MSQTVLSQSDRCSNAGELHDGHVVVLTNYLRRHHVAALREFSKRVRKLTVMLSIPMEPDRSWNAEWQDLDVQVQKNWMLTANWRHSSGFREDNFIHVPIDTVGKLRQLKPDVILSYEMGMRTMFSILYRRFNRDVPLVMVGNMSRHIEQERGPVRRAFRKLVCKGVDYFTYNGPSCRAYLESLGVAEDRLFPLPYCIDWDSAYGGQRSSRSGESEPIRLLFCGMISERKGILPFARALRRWGDLNPQQEAEFLIAGSGPLQEQVAAHGGDNIKITFLGNCNVDQLRDAYRDADICVFPTLADEWGLVPVEAMASGLPVLGSKYAQSVETCCVEGENGWMFDPLDEDNMVASLGRALATPRDEIFRMGQSARNTAALYTPENSANRMLDVVKAVARNRNPKRVNMPQTV